MAPEPNVFNMIQRYVERAYPLEGCGVVLEKEADFFLAPLANVSASASGHFEFDLREWGRLIANAEDAGARIAGVFHSHPDASSDFSAEDARRAAPSGDPLLPDVVHVVVAVLGGRAEAPRAFRWVQGRYREIALPVWHARMDPRFVNDWHLDYKAAPL